MPEIFTDKDSRIALHKRIITGLGLFVVILILEISNMLTNRFPRGAFWLIVLLMTSAIALALGYGLLRVYSQIRRLKKGQVSPAPGNK